MVKSIRMMSLQVDVPVISQTILLFLHTEASEGGNNQFKHFFFSIETSTKTFLEAI